MLKKSFITALVLIASFTFTIQAQAQYEIKDSYHFMKDDGIFSDEEKDEEAQYILEKCSSSILEQRYYNCECVAGAFRAKRDSEKLEPQQRILNNIYNDPKTKCADPVKTAGYTYNQCKESAKIFRSRKANNEEYCECVANTVSKSFIENPTMRLRSISKIRVNALTSCGIKYQNNL